MSLVDPETLNTASPDEIAQLAADCLAHLEPGFQILPLYTQLARISVGTTVEIFSIETSEIEPRVLFTQRPEDDPWWGGQWHVPGSVLLPTDQLASPHDFSEPAQRIFGGELAGLVKPEGDMTLFDLQRRQGVRGQELTPFFWTKISVLEDVELPENLKLLNGKDLTKNPMDLKFVEGHYQSALGAIASVYNPEKSLRKVISQFQLAA